MISSPPNIGLGRSSRPAIYEQADCCLIASAALISANIRVYIDINTATENYLSTAKTLKINHVRDPEMPLLLSRMYST
jgi:hypothetical protein